MKALIQRVDRASVSVDGEIKGQIGRGFLILLGVTEADTDAEVTMLTDKITKLRIFPDADGKTNCSIRDVDGAMLVISQFTLCADCRKGTRPSFSHAGKPEEANRLYELFIAKCRETVPQVECGVFGAHMQVELVNHGPFTVMLDTDDLKKPRNSKGDSNE